MFLFIRIFNRFSQNISKITKNKVSWGGGGGGGLTNSFLGGEVAGTQEDTEAN